MSGGGSDPSYSDGDNMNSIRRRIEWKQKSLVEFCTDGNIPDICLREVPTEMPRDFMARADEIRQNAVNTLKIYKADANYLWCREHITDLTPKELKRTCLEAILGYVSGLEQAIAKDDLITMRRHEHPERYTDSFEHGVQEISRLLSARENDSQLSLFSAVPTETDEYDENEEQEICM